MSIQIRFEREPSWRAVETLIRDPPCCFCGYNGPRYYLTTAHRVDCYWRQRGRGEQITAVSVVEESHE